MQPSATPIHSADNPTFRRLMVLLESARARREQGVAVLEGAHLLASWLQNRGARVDTIFLDHAAATIPSLVALVGQIDATRVVICETRLFRKASPVAGENGVLALVRIPAAFEAVPQQPGTFELWLDGVQDPGNVGTLIRSAAGAGASAVRLGVGCADAWSPKCLRAGMGGHFVLEVEERCNLAVRVPAAAGRVLAADGRAEASVFDTDLTGTLGILLGGEGAGIAPELLAMATHTVRIPMPGRVDSLNVAAAGAVLCFERVRQLAATVPKMIS